MSFYDAKLKVTTAASDASDARALPRHLRERTLNVKVVGLEGALGLEKNRIEKCLAMLRENKAMLSEVAASFYEALVRVLIK